EQRMGDPGMEGKIADQDEHRQYRKRVADGLRMRDRTDDAGARFPADHGDQPEQSDEGSGDVDAYADEYQGQEGNDADEPDRVVTELHHGLPPPFPGPRSRTPASAASSSAWRLTSAIRGTA